MRYFLEFSYQGQAYHGWQRQPDVTTVQQVLEEALSTLLRTTISLVGAGRTDAGVHAKQMYAHFDIAQDLEETKLVSRLNSFLPNDIAVKKIMAVKNDLHARFNANKRTYEYWIVQEKNVFLSDYAFYVRHDLDVDKMNSAASLLLKHNNFQCFSKTNTDVKTFLCALTTAKWEFKDGVLIFTIAADRFLRNMVRAIVGTLLEVGKGKMQVADIEKVLKSKNRSEAGTSVPAHALYLTKIEYPIE